MKKISAVIFMMTAMATHSVYAQVTCLQPDTVKAQKLTSVIQNTQKPQYWSFSSDEIRLDYVDWRVATLMIFSTPPSKEEALTQAQAAMDEVKLQLMNSEVVQVPASRKNVPPGTEVILCTYQPIVDVNHPKASDKIMVKAIGTTRKI